MPADGGKGRGVTKVLEYFGLKTSEAMAFGDGNNDLEMFQALDYCVAMGNGSEDLKKSPGPPVATVRMMAFIISARKTS